MKNPVWEQEETILLVDLYYKLNKISTSSTSEEAFQKVIELSKLLRKRAKILGYDVSDTYRNPKGITMKLGNIQYIDTNGEKGLPAASKFDKEMVEKYKSDPDFIHSQAISIRQKYEQADNPLEIDVCPLIAELKKLKKSSSEAVDNEESFSDFKKYMHIHRSLEDDLIKEIKDVRSNSEKGLILVCGNVGDGKSHIISFLKNTYPDLLDGFIIHNDATESKSRERDEKEELSKLLHNFKDTNLEKNTGDKIIVAINLGVLSNFINSEQGKEFTKLAEYINQSKILTDNVVSNYTNSNIFFHHVNFGDYHIYRLNDGKVDSPYISEVINKIFIPNANNPFYSKYKDCNSCTIKNCPVKHNYEMMQHPDISSRLINIIIETIVKDKIILSTRDLLDLFYDITVHPEFNKKEYVNISEKNRLSKYLDYCMPNILYEHDEISILLSHIKKYDLINLRSQKFDEITTQFNITENIDDIFKKYVSDNSVMNCILSDNINELCIDDKQLRRKLLYTFVRLCKLAPKESTFQVADQKFNNFIADLFYITQRNISKLKKLYSTVETCVYEWCGGSYNNKYINLKNDIEGYFISSELDIAPDFSNFSQVSSETSFERFSPYINLTLVKKGNTKFNATISIDYELYIMLKSVENGYRPTARDNNRFINFLTFVNRISEFSKYDEEITIRYNKNNEYKEYNLIKDEFGYSFSEVK